MSRFRADFWSFLHFFHDFDLISTAELEQEALRSPEKNEFVRTIVVLKMSETGHFLNFSCVTVESLKIC